MQNLARGDHGGKVYYRQMNVNVANCKSSVEGAGRRTEFARGAAERSLHSLCTLLPKMESKKYAV